MMFGLERMQLPLSLRLIRELHRLLDSGRGGTKSSGEFRTSQTWIGGTRLGNAMFVPPPPNEVTTCLGYAEHSAVNKAGLIHVQFETIHPFLDGNGRLGRLLITLFLGATGVLRQPLLYLSLYFKSRRADYYRLLQEVREDGTWEAWLEFFLEGVAETADQAFETVNRIARLFHDDRERIVRESERTGSVLHIHEIMRTSPYLTAASAAKRNGLTVPTVNAALDQLQKLGIVEEATGRRRGRVFVYRAYMDVLSDSAGS